MEINKRTVAIFLNTSMVVLTSTFIFFVLSIYKDKDDAQMIFGDNLFNSGLMICLFILPVIASFTFLISKVRTNPEEKDKLKNRFSFLLRCNTVIVLINITGLILLLHPFEIDNFYQVSYMTITLGGIVVGLLLFVLLNIYLRNGLRKQ